MDGWQNLEIMDALAQIEQTIEKKKIPAIPAVNFHITDDHLGEGGPKQKFANNIAAIETLFKLEQEGRNAAPAEQEILSKYVGWGGLADAFGFKSNYQISQTFTIRKLTKHQSK